VISSKIKRAKQELRTKYKAFLKIDSKDVLLQIQQVAEGKGERKEEEMNEILTRYFRNLTESFLVLKIKLDF
jgi:hypothetical protein